MTNRTDEQPSTNDLGSAAASVYGGLGIGLMVGALLGFAGTSPEGTTVGVFIGAVGTALAAMLGLNDNHFSKTKGLRIGSFGLAVVVAAPLAIYSRDHGLLTPQPAPPPTPAEQIAELTKAGYEQREALDILRASMASSSIQGVNTANAPAVKTSYLHSSNAEFNLCTDLAGINPDPMADLVESFWVYVDSYENGKKKWSPLLDYSLNDGSSTEALSKSDKQSLLFIARDVDCPSADFPDRLRATDEVCMGLDIPQGTLTERARWLVPQHDAALTARLAVLSSDAADSGFRLVAEFLCR
jgi:hypothetical protein